VNSQAALLRAMPAVHTNLEEVAESWIEAVLELGQEVPTPVSEATYSGRVLLRLPRSIHRKAAEAAERDGTSLNQYIVVALAERLGAARADTTTESRSSGGSTHLRNVYLPEAPPQRITVRNAHSTYAIK
jgi:hypothetical protein